LSAVRFLIALANAPFTIAVGVASVFALLQVTGILGLLAGHDGGDDGGGDHDVEADHDLDADADADHDADGADHDHDADGEHGRGIASAALAPLGLGKIPLSFIWQGFCLVFAAVGLAINSPYLDRPGGPPLITLVWTLPASLAAGYAGVAVLAKVLAPVLSSQAQEATSRAQLVGQAGVVISSKVDREFGEVRIRDKTGHDVRVVCKLSERVAKPPTLHQQVVVVEYDPERGELFVEPLEYDDGGDEAAKRSG
jgi:hypothetical protein